LTSELTEAQYLQEQAANAKAALKQTLTDFGQHLAGGVDLRNWAAKYPWWTVGGAAVAGFVAATVAVPSKEQQALKKLAAYERALRPPEPAKHVGDGNGHDGDGAKTEKKGLFASIAGDVIKSLGPALISAVTAGMGAQAATEGATANGNAAAGADQGATG